MNTRNDTALFKSHYSPRSQLVPRRGPLKNAGIILVALGALAMAMPLVSILAIEIEILIGSLLVVGGLLRVITLLQDKHWVGYWWSMISAVVVTLLGGVLIAYPLQGSITLTMILTALFMIEGIAGILFAMNFRQHSKSWLWILFNGLINLFLVFIIWQNWPTAASWLIGTLTGINMLFMGLVFINVPKAIQRRSA